MKNRTLSNNDVGKLILLGAIIFGAIFRMLPAVLAGFPVNDGGLFYTMITDIQANHYIPPYYTTYNNLHIPFAYPPLGLYLGAVLSAIFKIPPLQVVRWLPGIVNSLCIPVFYLLTREILRSQLSSAFATLVYALIPNQATWLSMGGGLTRSLGVFFMLFTLLYVYRVFAKEQITSIWGAILFGSLTVLSHTEAPLYTIALSLCIWAMKSRSMRGLQHGLLIAGGVIGLAGPWYGWVIYQHGLAPFASAIQTGGQTFFSILRLINVRQVTQEPYLELLGVSGVLGMAMLIIRKEYMIPVMLVVIFFSQPRSAQTVGAIPLAMAAGVFITDSLLYSISRIQASSLKNGMGILAIIVGPYILFNSIYQGYQIASNHVSAGEQAAMQWVKTNTPNDSRFLVLTGANEPMCESIAEWFPALTKRTSLTTIQGREWLMGDQFATFIGHRNAIQACSNSDLDCIDHEAGYFGNQIDYIYIPSTAQITGCQIIYAQRNFSEIISSLNHSSSYTPVYTSMDAVIFKRLPDTPSN